MLAVWNETLGPAQSVAESKPPNLLRYRQSGKGVTFRD